MPIYTANDLIQLNQSQKSVLIVGPPMTGKTRSLLSLARWLRKHNMGKLHLLDLDFKCESLTVPAQKEGLLDWIVVIRIVAPDTIQPNASRAGRDLETFEAFRTHFNTYQNQIDVTTGKWRANLPQTPMLAPGAVFIDSLTKFGEIVLEWVSAKLGHDLGDPKTDARDDYGRQMGKIMETVSLLKKLPCITGWLAHDQIMQDPQGKILRLPLITGKKLPQQFAKEFNCVLYSTVQRKDGKANYMWQVQPGENWVETAGVTGREDLPTFIPQDFEALFG